MTRSIVGVLAAFYALQSTWTLHAGFDALFPRVTVIVTPDSCCASACGCPEDVRKRGDCCCGPEVKQKEAAPRTVTTSAFDVAKCSGLELAMAQAVGLPALDAFPRLELEAPAAVEVQLPEPRPDLDVLPSEVDKVPL